MSLIIYKDKVLYADNSGLKESLDVLYPVKCNKIFKTKHFVIAFVGQEINEQSDIFKEYLIKLEEKLKDKSLEEFKLEVKDFPENECLIITSEYVYNSENCKEYKRENSDVILARGAGSGNAMLHLTSFKLSIMETYELYKGLCTGCYFTEITKFHMDQLEPFN